MNDLIYSLNATMPVFLVILAGYIFIRMGMFSEGFISSANKFLFNVCLPVMVFEDLASENIIESFNGSLVIFSGVITTIAFAVIWLCAKLFIRDKLIVGAFVQAAYRSSVAVMGFAFMQNICGDSGLIPMIIIGCVPLYNIYAVTVLTFEAEDAVNDTDKSRCGNCEKPYHYRYHHRLYRLSAECLQLYAPYNEQDPFKPFLNRFSPVTYRYRRFL